MLVAIALKNKRLIIELVKRDIVGKYRGSLIGNLWAVLNPVLMLSVYTFVFTIVFKPAWTTKDGANFTNFAIIIFCGLIVSNFYIECLSRAASLIINHPAYVKKVVFPLEILPYVVSISSFFHLSIATIVLCFAAYLEMYKIGWIYFYIPIIYGPLFLNALGVIYILSALGVYFRDIGQIINFVSLAMQFLAPVFYPSDAVPSNYRYLLFFNPLTVPIESLRDVIVYGRQPDLIVNFIYMLYSILIFALGYYIFRFLKTGFADIL